MRPTPRLLLSLSLGALGVSHPLPAHGVLIDDFEDASAWSPHPADGVSLTIGSDEGVHGRALRLDVAFTGGGYAVARKDVALDLPENYAFSFAVRGNVPTNHLEFKLIDESGENVWWAVRRDFEFSGSWVTVRHKKRHIRFAWGPAGGGEIRHVAAIEIVVTAGSGGSGTVWIDDLALTPLPPEGARLPPPTARTSTAARASTGDLAIDGDVETAWSPSPGDRTPWIALDFGRVREYGGLTLDWDPGRHPATYTLEASDDGAAWRTLSIVEGGNGERDDLFLPETESRYLRLRLSGSMASHPGEGPVALAELTVQPIAWSASRESFFETIAKRFRRGSFPRGMSGEQTYWTVLGLDDDRDDALMGEDGAIETHRGGFSIEPLLFLRGGGERLLTWADVQTSQSLDRGYLPIPSVTWRSGCLEDPASPRSDVEMTVTACATGTPGAGSLVATYRVVNDGDSPRGLTLYLAIRPFQVNPPSQTLNTPGGTARVEHLSFDGRTVGVNDAPALYCLTSPSAFGAAPFHEGDIVTAYLEHGRLPAASSVRDDFGAASGAVAFALDLAPHSEATVVIAAPLGAGARVPSVDPGDALQWAERVIEESRAFWSARIRRVSIELPASADRIVETLESQIGYIFVNRAGPAIRPGSRAYARSWIRDGALTSTALLRFGHADAVRAFIDWYAPHQYDNGKVPCVVDDRGADPVPEHDSSGELVYLIAEYYRHTGDLAFVERMWPRVRAAALYLDALRRENTSDAERTADRVHFYGILPPSISHEGYSAKPMHSYWDDLFALQGFRDAEFLAGELDLGAVEDTLASIRKTFERDFGASVVAAMRRHDIDYIPGCADLGDFDPTSTTIALSPVDATGVLPGDALRRTFERYASFFVERIEQNEWEAYTPYEIRNVGAFIRLGWNERAHQLLDFFFADQRPRGWNHWAEVVARDARTPRFIGDMPHTWVGSDYIRSVLDMFAYTRESDATLVLAGGVPDTWLSEDPGVRVRGLSTRHGLLDLCMHAASDTLVVEIAGSLTPPSGGLAVRLPPAYRLGDVRLNGRPAVVDPAGEVRVREVPVTVRVTRPVPAAPR